MNTWVLRHTALLGALIFTVALIAFGAMWPGYSHLHFPFDALGARDVPQANAYNLLGLMWPGLMAAMAMMQLRQRLPTPSGWPLRIGAQLVLLSCLGLVAMGLLPLDPTDLHNPASSWHATAWMLWWVSFCPGAWLLAWGLRGQAAWRGLARASALAPLLLLALVLVGVAFLPAGLVQRLTLALWWGWLILAGRSGWNAVAARVSSQ
jgi:hypothetical membrane protein